MPNQSDFLRVNTHMITPLCLLYGYKMHDSVVEDFVSDICEFDEETLKAAYAKLRREENTMPRIAKVLKACEACKPPAKVSHTPKRPEGSFTCQVHVEISNPGIARQILHSPVGQLALSLGVARDLLITYECTGRRDFDEIFVRKCKRGLDDAVNSLRETNSTTSIGTVVHAFFETMTERERRLYEKYYQPDLPKNLSLEHHL